MEITVIQVYRARVGPVIKSKTKNVEQMFFVLINGTSITKGYQKAVQNYSINRVLTML